MREALAEANLAYQKGEVPVGAVVVFDNEIVGRGHNQRETKNQVISHAEIEALQEACSKLGRWRLEDCDIYVTLEPCAMCAGAILNARINSVFFGAFDEKTGCLGSKINLFDCGFNHRPHIKTGMLESECSDILKKFFQNVRNR